MEVETLLLNFIEHFSLLILSVNNVFLKWNYFYTTSSLISNYHKNLKNKVPAKYQPRIFAFQITWRHV